MTQPDSQPVIRLLYALDTMKAYSKTFTTSQDNQASSPGGPPANNSSEEVVVEVQPKLEEVSQEDRRLLLKILLENKRISAGTLGVSRAYIYMMKTGKRPIPDTILLKLLEAATDDDLARVPSLARYVDYSKIKSWEVDRIVKMFVEWARANPASAKAAYETIGLELERLGLSGRVVKVTEHHLREWELFLEARVREGKIKQKTAKERRIYLERALEELGYVLGPSRVQSYLRRLVLESADIAAHTAKALKLFSKYVLRDRDLYEAIPSINPRRGKREAPSWEDICRLIGSLEWPPARAYMLILAATGVRSGYVRLLRLDQLDLDRRLINLEVEERTKRQYIAFMTEGVRDYLVEVYLPWRELHLEKRGIRSGRLFPVRRDRLHHYIYDKMDEVLGYRFQPYTVRHRVLTHFARHLPSLEAKLLSGHASRDVYLEYYYQLDRLEELRSKYDRAMSSIPCLSGVD